MEGSLWRRKIGTANRANQEVTHPAAAYDHQPDVAPDGDTRRLHALRRKGLRTLAPRPRERHRACTDRERRRQPRAAHFAERPPDRVRLDCGHRLLQPEDCGSLARWTFERALTSWRRARAASTAITTRSTTTPSILPGRPTESAFGSSRNAEIPWGTGWICSIAVDGRRAGVPRASISSKRPGPRDPKSARTGSASCSRTTTAASGTSSGSRPPTTRRRCR